MNEDDAQRQDAEEEGGLTEADIRKYLELTDRIRAEAFCSGYDQATGDAGAWACTGDVGQMVLLDRLKANATAYRDAYEVLPQIQKGIAEAKAGKTVSLGDFTQHLTEKDKAEVAESHAFLTPEAFDAWLDEMADSTEPYPNPLVEEIFAELDKRDGMVGDVIVFVLAHAAQKLRAADDGLNDHHMSEAIDLIDPTKAQP